MSFLQLKNKQKKYIFLLSFLSFLYNVVDQVPEIKGPVVTKYVLQDVRS